MTELKFLISFLFLQNLQISTSPYVQTFFILKISPNDNQSHANLYNQNIFSYNTFFYQ